MDYRMRKEYLSNYCLKDNAEDEKILVEDFTKEVFHRWNDKLEILTRICDWYGYGFRFYPDGRLVLQMLRDNTKEKDFEWRGKDDCGHLEYQSLDDMLIDWLDELKQNEGSYKFDEEIIFIENMKENSKKSCMPDLKDLLQDGEALVKYHLHNEYISRNAITEKGSTDISASLEMTLHRILESGGTENNVYEIMGAKIPTEEEIKELEEFDEYTEIDLGYVLPGLIDMWKESEDAECQE